MQSLKDSSEVIIGSYSYLVVSQSLTRLIRGVTSPEMKNIKDMMAFYE